MAPSLVHLPPEVADLEIVRMDSVVSSVGAGGVFDFLAKGYGVVVKNLATIKDPKFQKGLLAVDRTMRPKHYAALAEETKTKRQDARRSTTPRPSSPSPPAHRTIKGTVLGIVAMQMKVQGPLKGAMDAPVIRAYKQTDGKHVVPIADVANAAMSAFNFAKGAAQNKEAGTKFDNKNSPKGMANAFANLFANVGGVDPTIGTMSLEEAEAMLEGLVQVNMVQYQDGEASIVGAIESGAVVYDRRDPDEHWQSVKELWMSGRGDCEDLSAALAARRRLDGDHDARVIVTPGRGRVAHAQVALGDGTIEDPSVWAGM
jgi:hypothetical protein